MIVPFIFNIHKLSNHQPEYLWVFYKFINFCEEYGYPIIGQESYFKPVKYYSELGHPAANEDSKGLLEYKIPNDDFTDRILSYKITEEFENRLLNGKGRLEIWSEILGNRNSLLEAEIYKAIDSIEDKTGKKIECMICWMSFPSLQHICEVRGITLINYEMSSIRVGDVYNGTLGYFAFADKHTVMQIDEYAESYSIEKTLSRKEILAMFLNTQRLNYLYEMDEMPSYEFGISRGMEFDPIEMSHEHVPFSVILSELNGYVKEKQLLVRANPGAPKIDFGNCEFEIDQSVNSAEWIFKCKRIVSNISNIGFEPMLYGKTSYVLSDSIPFYKNAVNSLDTMEDSIVDLKYLNLLVFAFFAPFELMFDKDYILWRLEKPTVNEIYNRNIEFLLKKYGLSDRFFDMKRTERLTEIFTKIHNLNSAPIVDIDQFSSKKMVEREKLENDINELQVSNQILQTELTRMLNSKSWKITEPLRKAMGLMNKQ